MLDKYPRINYPLSVDDDDLPVYYQLRDITTRVNLILTDAEKQEYFEVYEIREGDRPEDVAFKLYGDEGLHWTIMYANERHNYLDNWYKSALQVEEYCIDKYGAERLNALHSIIDSYGNRVGTPYEKYGTYTGNSVTDTITADIAGHGYSIGSRVYLHFTSGNGETGSYTITNVPNSDSFVVAAPLGSNTSGSCSAALIGADRLWLNNTPSLTVSSYPDGDIRGLTNYEYELMVNERLRYIRAIKPKYISAFISAFNDQVKNDRS
jgi:hypothetical protein